MAKRPSKRLSLLEAYADLARREAFCLNEGNIEPLARIQEKKASMLEGLAEHAKSPREPGEAARIAILLADIQSQEAASASLLKERMGANRAELRKLAQSSKSAAGILKAYSAPEAEGGPRSSLKDRV